MVVPFPQRQSPLERLNALEEMRRNCVKMLGLYESEWKVFGDEQIAAVGLAGALEIESVEPRGERQIVVVLNIATDPPDAETSR